MAGWFIFSANGNGCEEAFLKREKDCSFLLKFRHRVRIFEMLMDETYDGLVKKSLKTLRCDR
jgi:hypothetical protein